MLLFLYGTLLDPRLLARRSGERGPAWRLLPARLDGHARVALRGTPFPTLARRPGPTPAAQGCSPTAPAPGWTPSSAPSP